MVEGVGDSPLIAAHGIVKSFGAVRALRGVDLTVRRGQVHGLVGANGAGKSTLIRVLAGIHEPDAGTVEVDGERVRIHTASDADRLGFAFIHQELNLIPTFTVAENLALGVPSTYRVGFVDRRRVAENAASVAERLGYQFPLNALAGRLSVPNQWLVSIGRALVKDARMIVMDEPSASLSATEAERLFAIVRELAADGVAVLYVSHRLNEIVDLCDQVTIFKDGQTVTSLERGDFDHDDLVRGIVGREVRTVFDVDAARHTEPILTLTGISRPPLVKGVDLTLHKGEVLGIAGLVGAGRTETAEVIFGVARPEAGAMTLRGRPYAPGTPTDAVRSGVALVPEERRAAGVLLKKSIAFNLNLPTIDQLRLARVFPWLNIAKGKRRAAEVARRLTVKHDSVDQLVGNLSGGNQQKVVIGKWLVSEGVDVLVLDEPSRGVDIGARTEIYAIIRGLADAGMAVLIICSEFSELTVCDRVLVMVEGCIVGEVTGDAINEENLLHLCYAKGGSHP